MLGLLNHCRCTVLFEEETESFARTELHDGVFCLEGRIGAESASCCFHSLLIVGREGTQCMLDAVAQLAKYRIWNINRVLRDEIDANPFRTDKTNHLFDLVHQSLGRIVKKRVSFIKEEDEPWQRQIADFRQLCIDFRKAAKAGRLSKNFGFCISLSAASTFMIPLPPSHCIRSLMLNEGSPKKMSAP